MLPELERFPLVIVPGINGSGPEHWQTYWEAAHAGSHRITPESYDEPELEDWVRAVDHAVASCESPPLIAAHSLGCLATVAWAAGGAAQGRVAAVLMVAAPDPSDPAFPVLAPSFVGVMPAPLGVPSAVVASTDDQYASVEYEASLAAGSGAVLHVVGALGHINADTALGEWPEGQRILADLIAGAG
jgi:hypothetical protein